MFEDISAERAGFILASCSDIALIVDGDGIIRDVASGSEDMPEGWFDDLLERPWAETVTVESREKVERLLKEAGSQSAPSWRHINHPSAEGADLPLLYTVVPIGEGGRLAAVGRDLRPLATLQQRLIQAQQAIERDYARLRQAEMRYRLLFEMASEAILIVDSAAGKIVEANPAAADLLGTEMKKLVGRGFPIGFESASTQAIEQLFVRVRATPGSEQVEARRANGESVLISASMFRQDNAAYFLVRMTPVGRDGAETAVPKAKRQAIEVLESAPDGFVVTDMQGCVLMANQSFADLVEVASEDQVRGHSMERWLGRFGSEFNVVLATLREHGSLRFFATSLRGEYGGSEDVELSAVSVPQGEEPCIGFILRPVGGRVPQEPAAAVAEGPRSVDQLTELVGRVPLREIVRESSEVIERLCIEAALQLTGNNRASAAEMLGLSRQSLYVKLRRYGLGNIGSDSDD